MGRVTDYGDDSRVRSGRSVGRWRDGSRFRCHDAVALMLPSREAREVVAAAFGCKPEAAEKWQRDHEGPTASGNKSPLLRFHEALRHLYFRLGVPIENVMAFYDWSLAGFQFRRALAIEVDEVRNPSEVLAGVISDPAGLAAYLAEALADRHIDKAEKRGLRVRIRAALESIRQAELLANVGAGGEAA